MAELNRGQRSPWIGPAVGVVLVVLVICCCLGAVLIQPNLGRRHTISRYSEARTNLKYAYVAEKAFFGERDRYDESVEAVGFFPERANRYRYVLSKGGDALSPGDAPDGGPHTGILADTYRYPTINNAVLLSAIPPALLSTAGIDGTCPACDITIIAAGDIDSDPTVDVWSVSTKERTIDGERVPAGMPFRHVNDTDD